MNDDTDGSDDVNRAFMTYSTDAPLSGNITATSMSINETTIN